MANDPVFTIDATKFRLGAHRVKWNSVELGVAQEGMEIKIKEDWLDQFADQTGTMPLDAFYQGEVVTVTMKLKEWTAGLLSKALQASTLASALVSGGGKIAGSVKASSKYQLLTLHPLDTADATTTSDWNFFKAMPMGDFSTPLGSGENMVIPITFKCYPDLTKDRGVQVWTFGS